MIRCPSAGAPSDARAPGVKGREAELAAHHYLLQHGYQPIARNVRTRFGEIDIVAKDGATLVFLEVKSRSGAHAAIAAGEAVGRRKQAKVRMVAEWFMREQGYDPGTDCRFDVVLVEVPAHGLPAATVVRDAF